MGSRNKLNALAVVLTAIAATLVVGRTTDALLQPNILIVLTDDQRAEAMEAMPLVRSWMETQGTAFDHFYASTPICCPSRASIMSGKYTHNHHVPREGAIRRFKHSETIQRELRDAGYRTAVAGKFINGWNLSRKPPYFHESNVGEGYRGATFVEDGKKKRNVPYGPSYVFGQARGWLNRFEGDDLQPWYLYLNPSSPHSPYTPQRPYRNDNFPWAGTPATDEDNRSDKPAYVRHNHVSEREGKKLRTRQLRTLQTVDKEFDDLMTKLNELGELANTYVIFSSDNGYLWGDHGMVGKAVPYLGAVGVPMFIRGPGIAPGAVDTRIAGNIDIAPTVFDMAGVTPGYTPDGRSLLGAWTRPYLLLHSGAKVQEVGSEWRSLISDDWQYVRYARGGDEYYDLDADPFQLTNLYRDGNPSNDPPPPLAELQSASNCRGATCP